MSELFDKASMPGPWQAEPDRLEWQHKGVPCLIVRGPWGALCGYAACNPGHPWHGKDFSDLDVDVHGGLTYSEACQGKICHVPMPGEPDDVWWLGFDCAHCRDLVPASLVVGIRAFDAAEYRTVDYVKAECEGLAEQILRAEERAS